MNSLLRFGFSILLISLFIRSTTFSQASPKREFRGAWIATVINLDWPSSRFLSTSDQQTELVTLLNSLKAAGCNAVIFQVRTECDAFYDSPFDPWSHWLTGAQGTPPNPYYDPLEFAIGEAHARGMELHAWFNPYRAQRNSDPASSGYYDPHPSHVTVLHPDWILSFPAANHKIVNPGLPEVRDYVASVVSDIVRRYDVDGIHADDYFYPYPSGSFSGITTEDTATFSEYPNGFESNQIKDWRRDNVNRLLVQIYDSVQAIKPHVKFGMSPFGIWRPSDKSSEVPPGIFGLDAYDVIYADAIAWLQGQYIDYLTPQLYWAFGGGQDYGSLQPWWADSAAANGRHLYTGNATYRINTSGFGGPDQVKSQIDFNRANPKVQGHVQFRANFIRDNIGGWTDLLKADLFRSPAALPGLDWKEQVPPDAPSNLTVDSSGALYVLNWDPPPPAVDSDTASRYLVYRFHSSDTTDRENSRYLLSLEGGTTVIPSGRVDTINAQYHFAISALDRNNNESGLSNLVSISRPVSTPVPVNPADSGFFARNGSVHWTKSAFATSYLLQISRSPDFHPDSIIASIPTADTSAAATGLAAQETYYWRVAAGGQAGSSDHSPMFTFTAGWPFPPELVSPLAATNIPRTPTFVWRMGLGTSFTIRILDASNGATVLQTTVNDTTYTSALELAANKVYGWQVMAANTYGSSDWSVEGRFRTETSTLVERDPLIPETFDLSQNYPNPFNPETQMRFDLPEFSSARLVVYDILGRQVTTLVNEDLPPGRYTVTFNGDRLPSGPYIAVFQAGGVRIVKKMLLVK